MHIVLTFLFYCLFFSIDAYAAVEQKNKQSNNQRVARFRRRRGLFNHASGQENKNINIVDEDAMLVDRSHEKLKRIDRERSPMRQRPKQPHALSGLQSRRGLPVKKNVVHRKNRSSMQEEARERDLGKEIEAVEMLDKAISYEEHEQDVFATEEGLPKVSQKKNKKKNRVITLQDQAIYLNFEKIKLASFINYIAGIKKINVIPDKATESVEISIAIREPLSLDGAWQVFLTMLEMHGFSIIEIGPEGNKANVHKIIPRQGKSIERLPSFFGSSLDALPDSDITIRYVGFLQNIGISEISGLLTSMLGPDSRFLPQPNINGFIITDKSLNIKSALKVVQELDQSGLQETVVVRRLQKANALEVKTLLESLISSPQTSPLARLLGKKSEGSVEYFSSTTKIVSEDRSNSLILLGNHKSIQVIEDFIDRYFEAEERFTKSPLKVFTFQYAEATQMRDLLTEVINNSDNAPTAKFGGVLGGVKYFKNMNFQVDERGNQLIVSCADPRDWKILKPTLKALDTAQPSVFIETLVVSVNAEDAKELGGQFRPKFKGSLGNNIGFQSAGFAGISTEKDSAGKSMSLFGNLLELVQGFGRGSTVLSFGKDANIWAVFKALKSEVNASVISQPFITVANRVKATIKVGDKRRIIKEQAVSDGGDVGEAKSFTDQDALTNIEYTPQINLDGIITLQVDATIADFVGADGTQEKKLATNVSVASGQVLVLGGFVKTSLKQSEGGTPFLSRIPILGWLCKNKQRSINKQYIFIFVCPTIIKPRQTPGMDLYTKMKLHGAKESVEAAIDTKKVKDPIHNWFFNPDGETYAHKVVDFATARYQPSIVDIKNDPDYRSKTERDEKKYGAQYNELDVMPEELPAEEPIKDTTFVLQAEKKVEKEQDPVLEKERKQFKKTFEADEEDALYESKNGRDKKPLKLLAPEEKNEIMIDSRNRLKDILSMGAGSHYRKRNA